MPRRSPAGVVSFFGKGACLPKRANGLLPPRSRPPTWGPPGKPAMIHVSHLTKYYGDYAAVRDVSFDVPAGRVVGFLGPNGAGKTTTMRILTGYLAATSGTAT